MASHISFLAAALTLLSYVRAFSPDQCDLSTYGAPTKTACNTLLTTISTSGVGNTSYLFIPSEFPTPAGLSNGTRKNFPITWSGTGCNAALVPVQIDNTTVTWDTSTYQDIASAGTVVVQQCISNKTSSGGWELAGDNQDLVLHLYATGSQIDRTIKQETSTQIAATSEDEIDNAEEDDPAFNGTDGGIYGDDTGLGNGTDTGLGNGTDTDTGTGTDSDLDSGSGTGTGTGTGTGSSSSAGVSSAAGASSASRAQNSASSTAGASTPSQASSAAKVVQSSGTFKYVGCQADSASSRTLSSLSWSGTGLTVQRCAAYCAEYQYMGVEFGSQCYCGGDANGKGVKPATTVRGAASNNCTTPCNGDATQLCGGTLWLNTYQNSNEATAGATA